MEKKLFLPEYRLLQYLLIQLLELLEHLIGFFIFATTHSSTHVKISTACANCQIIDCQRSHNFNFRAFHVKVLVIMSLGNLQLPNLPCN